MLLSATCPKCKSPLEGNACTECNWTERSRRPVFTRSAGGVACAVELTILVDRTGSGALFSRGVELSTGMILTAVEQQVRSLRVWVQTHGDEDYQEFPQVIASACQASQASQAIGKIEYAGGGDDKETHLSAVETALEGIDWQQSGSNTRRVLLMFVNDDTKPARSGRSAAVIGQTLQEAGVLFYLICQSTQTLTALAESARGLICEITNDPSAELMQAIATQITGSVIHSVSTGSAAPARTVRSPAGGRLPAVKNSLVKRLPWSKPLKSS